MSTYRVEASRDDDLVLIRVPELGLLSQARSVASARDSARDLIAVWLEVDPAAVSVTMDYHPLAPDAGACSSSWAGSDAQP